MRSDNTGGIPAMTEEQLERIYGRHSWSECKDWNCGGNFVCQACGERVGWCLQGRDHNALRCAGCESAGRLPDPGTRVGRADYAGRREARVQRLRKRAEKLRKEGESRLASARRTSEMIPLGQPILVGHHSERRHRRDLKRIHDGYDKGFRALNEATKLESRACTAERNDAISSDDPNAPERIREKIAKIEKLVAAMKEANKLIRRAKGDSEKAIAALVAAGFAPGIAGELVKPDFAGRVGYAGYWFTNRSAEIRRLKARLAHLADVAEEQAKADEQGDEQIGDVTLRVASNRVQLVFPGKPADSVRRELKSHGFRWAPSEGAWQRLLSHDARYWAERIARQAQGA